MEPILVTTVEKESSDAPLLIIDHKGIVGSEIYDRVNKELVTAFVSNKQPKASANLVYIPYKHRIPEIPNGKYSLIIFVSDHEKDSPEIAKKCIEKAKTDGIPFIFIIDYTMADQKFLEKIVDAYEDASVIILGEFFGQGDSIIDSYILQAGTSRTIKLPRMGLRKTRPVLFADAMQGILQILFGSQRRQRITFLYPHHEYTDLSIAHMLQKIDPLIHIDFFKDGKKKSVKTRLTSLPAGKVASLPSHHGQYLFDKDYSIPEKIIEVYNTVSSKRKNANDTYIYKEEIKPLLDLSQGDGFIPEPIKKWGGLTIFYVFIIILFPILCLGISGLVAESAFKTAKIAMEKGDVTSVRQQLGIAHTAFVFDDIVKTPVLSSLKALGAIGFAQQLDTKITTGREASLVVERLFMSQDTLRKIITGESVTPESDITAVVSSMRASLSSLQNILVTDNQEKEFLQQVGKYQKGIDLASGTVGLLPHILATNGKHTYLVLFQDNMELRPGGGLISSYGLITFDHGKMSDFTIHDVSVADGQLHKHVDPQFAIRRDMGIVHQYLNNSNFDADFVVDAQKATDMFQLETGQRIDGVMAVDLTFVQSLLAATGPLYIPAQHTTVTAAAFLELTKQHVQPTGSTKENIFLHDVLVTVWGRLHSGKGINITTLTQKSLQAIQEKHLLFALANITDQNQLTVNQLSSSLWDPRPQNTGVINDYLGINEANLSANKVNYFMKRQVKQSVSIDGDGLLKGEVLLTYTNASKATEWPGGDYKNYIKIIVPKDTILTGISFNGVSQATRSAITDPLFYESRGFKAPAELEIEQTQEFGKTVYAFLVTIPAGYAKTVSVMYAHAQKINLSNPVLHYSLYLYKQPGIANDPFSFSFNFPLEYSILSANPANGDGNSDYTLDTQLSEDKIITVDLTKK